MPDRTTRRGLVRAKRQRGGKIKCFKVRGKTVCRRTGGKRPTGRITPPRKKIKEVMEQITQPKF